MSFIGLDPSLTSFGVCLYESKTQHGETFTATSSPAKGLEERFCRYRWLLNTVMARINDARRQDLLESIAVEGYSFGSRGSALLDLAEFGGIVRERLLQMEIPIIEIPPTQVKKFVCGKGAGKGTDKDAFAVALYKRYGVECDTSDERDAYALARMAACYAGAEEPQTAVQRSVIESLKAKSVK